MVAQGTCFRKTGSIFPWSETNLKDFVDFYSSCGFFPSHIFNLQGLFQHSSDFTPAPEKEWPSSPENMQRSPPAHLVLFSFQSLCLCLEHVLQEVGTGEGDSICSGIHQAPFDAQPSFLLL